MVAGWEADSEERLTAVITFDPDDRRAAAKELLERFARSDEGQRIPAAAREASGAINAHDLERLRAALSEHFLLDDHRRTGLGRLESADASVAATAALFERVPDWRFEPLYFIAIAEHGLLVLTRALGTLADAGGELEQVYVLLSHEQAGRLVGLELFEPEDLERARTRFAELCDGKAVSE